MKADIHQQVQQWIACAGVEDVAGEGSASLQQHLLECPSCRDYADAASQMVEALRSVPFAADSNLVRSTQQRVRARAYQLQQERNRLQFVWMSCALVAFAAAVTTPFLWQGFRWISEIANVSTPVWQIGFAIFWISPSLAISVFLVARGIHLDHRNNTSAN
jgi:predicted anti-sigma-YlaC factor YlaD